MLPAEGEAGNAFTVSTAASDLISQSLEVIKQLILYPFQPIAADNICNSSVVAPETSPVAFGISIQFVGSAGVEYCHWYVGELAEVVKEILPEPPTQRVKSWG